MNTRTARRLAWTTWTLTMALLVLGEVLNIIKASPSVAALFRFYPVAAAFATAGALIIAYRPQNRVGWVVSAVGLLFTIYDVSRSYAAYAPSAKWVVWLASWSWFPGELLAVGVLPLLFPDGRLPSRRWRFVLWLASAGLAAGVVGAVGRSPAGIGVPRGFRDVALLLFLACLVLSMSSLAVRFRRANLEQRQQLKWFINAMTLIVLLFIGAMGVGLVILHGPPFDVPILDAAIHLSFVSLPVAIGIAVLKYRLYDIDLVINKALLFGALAVFITAVYVGIVAGIGALVGRGGQPNLALSILATAVVAVAFEPVRERVQRFANRLVYGKRASPYEVMADFSERMAGALSVEEVLPKMAEAAARGVGARQSRVRLFLPGGGDRATGWPADARDGHFDRTLTVAHRGERVGEIAVSKPTGEPITPAEDKLLSDLAAQAGLVLHNVRLTLELQARLAEISARAAQLRASRQRIVAAQDAERGRLAQTIREGAERQLVSMGERVQVAEQELGRDPAKASATLDELTAEANRTLEALRELARGIYPPLLRDQGLPAALKAQAARMRIPVEVTSDDVGRYPSEVEAAVYFCCLEALRGTDQQASVHFSPKDDGLGFTIAGAGFALDAVLQDMEDRVEALGGRLTVGRRQCVGQIPTRMLEPVA